MATNKSPRVQKAAPAKELPVKAAPTKELPVKAAPKAKEKAAAPKVSAIVTKVIALLPTAKIKEKDGITTVTAERMSASHFSKLKVIGGKKAELTSKGENWVITYPA